MPVTLKDIANKSGYSVTTVSRAITGYNDVNPKTRQHILKIAEDLGYQPNDIARQLQGQKTYMIGLITPTHTHTDEDDFFSLLLKGIIYGAATHGYDVLTSAIHPKSSEMEAYKRIVGGKRVDGMIIARNYCIDTRINYLQDNQHPFIVNGRRSPGEVNDFPYIDVDSALGIQMLTEHLLERGHTQIGIILPEKSYAFTNYRLLGYQKALEKHDIPFDADYTIHSPLTYVGGQEAAQKILAKNPDLTALIGSTDWIALGAMFTAKELGHKIGQDFAVVGYDNIPAARHSNPGLTTIHQPIYEIGEQLTHELIQLIENDPAADTQLLIKPELIIRESSGVHEAKRRIANPQ